MELHERVLTALNVILMPVVFGRYNPQAGPTVLPSCTPWLTLKQQREEAQRCRAHWHLKLKKRTSGQSGNHTVTAYHVRLAQIL